MKHYKDKAGNIFAYPLDGSQDHLIEEKEKVTDKQAQKLIEAKQKEVFNALSYANKRRKDYPTIGDQLDDLFKAGAFSKEMAKKIKSVKDKYPKE